MTYTRITAVWSGAAGLPGYSRFRFFEDLTSAGAVAAAGRVRQFFSALANQLPPNIIISFSEAAQIYNVNNVLTGEVSYAPPAAVLGTGTAGYAAPVGMVVNWLTGAVANGRKIRGRTFLVPVHSNSFSADGTPGSAIVTQIQTAAAALAGSAPPLCIAQTVSPGVGRVTAVSGASVPDRAAILRSRRD